MAGVARQSHEQQVHYLRKRINYNDANVAGGVYVGTLPAGALIDSFASFANVSTAFNAGTTNVVAVGTTAGGNNVGAAIPGGATGATRLAAADALGPMAADTDIFVTYTQTGAAATAGLAYVVIAFVPNNDL